MCIVATSALTSAPDRHLAKDIPACVPKDELSQKAYIYAQEHLHPTIFNHCLRVYVYAHTLASQEQKDGPWLQQHLLPLLFIACLFHDMGTCAAHDGPQRFEVEGGDAAVSFIETHGSGNTFSAAEVHDVWIAIAIHTSPGIAERINPLARALRLAVALDFGRYAASPAALGDSTELSVEVKEAERLFPRGDIEKVLGDAVAEQALAQPQKAPAASWPGNLLRSAKENPGWAGVNKGF